MGDFWGQIIAALNHLKVLFRRMELIRTDRSCGCGGKREVGASDADFVANCNARIIGRKRILPKTPEKPPVKRIRCSSSDLTIIPVAPTEISGQLDRLHEEVSVKRIRYFLADLAIPDLRTETPGQLDRLPEKSPIKRISCSLSDLKIPIARTETPGQLDRLPEEVLVSVQVSVC